MFHSELKSRPDEDISLLIKVANYSRYFICDCGDASDLSVKECQNTEAIFITHAHIDHFINFDTILRHQIGIKRRVIICGPAGITALVQAKLRGYLWNLITPDAITYEVREIRADGSIQCSALRPATWDIEPLSDVDTLYRNDLFGVDFTQLNHKTTTIAYRFKAHDTTSIELGDSGLKGGSWVRDLKIAFEQNDPERAIVIDGQTHRAQSLYHLLSVNKGETLGFIMDHNASEENHAKIAELFTDCDTVFIESFYKKADIEQAKANYHSYSEASAKIMRRCRVRHPIPVHFSRKYNAEEVAELIAEFDNIYNDYKK